MAHALFVGFAQAVREMKALMREAPAQPRARRPEAGRGLASETVMSALALMPGPVMLDVAGQALSEDDRRRLRHPLVGGVILFARNYASPEQVAALTAEIRALRCPELL